jgi:hypothetical protein
MFCYLLDLQMCLSHLATPKIYFTPYFDKALVGVLVLRGGYHHQREYLPEIFPEHTSRSYYFSLANSLSCKGGFIVERVGLSFGARR